MSISILMSRFGIFLAIVSQISFIAAAPTSDPENTSLPIVDLGVSLIQATLNSSGLHPYYNFSNIRYAQPPVGHLRFDAPVAPTVRNSTVNDGQHGVVCPQASPGSPLLSQFLQTHRLIYTQDGLMTPESGSFTKTFRCSPQRLSLSPTSHHPIPGHQKTASS